MYSGRICPKCGKSTTENDAFCPFCGKKLTAGKSNGKRKKILIAVLSVLTVLIVTIVLVVVFANPFRAKEIEKIELGKTTTEYIEKKFGKPTEEYDSTSLGAKETTLYDYINRGDRIWVYYESAISRKIEKIKKISANPENFDELDKLYNELKKATSKPFRSIVVAFDEENIVTFISLNSKTEYSETDLFASAEEKEVNTIELNEKTAVTGTDLQKEDFFYTATFKDGSIIKSYLPVVKGYDSSKEGVQTITFSDGWGEYEKKLLMIKPNVIASANVWFADVQGRGYYKNGDAVTVSASESVIDVNNNNYTFNGWYDEEDLVSTEGKYTFTFDGNPVTLYAKYIAFYCNDGVLTGVSDETVSCLSIPDSVTSIGSSAFSGCSKLASVTIPDSVTSIGSSAFSGCSKLASVTIPDSITSIGNSAFSDCSKLASVTIPDSVTSIGNSAFSDCSKLASITIPDSVTSMGSSVFYNCIGLENVAIGKGIREIGSHAFYNCGRLASVSIGSGITRISGNAFYHCTELKSIIFSGTMFHWSSIEKGLGWNNLTGNYVIHCVDGDIEK